MVETLFANYKGAARVGRERVGDRQWAPAKALLGTRMTLSS